MFPHAVCVLLNNTGSLIHVAEITCRVVKIVLIWINQQYLKQCVLSKWSIETVEHRTHYSHISVWTDRAHNCVNCVAIITITKTEMWIAHRHKITSRLIKTYTTCNDCNCIASQSYSFCQYMSINVLYIDDELVAMHLHDTAA